MRAIGDTGPEAWLASRGAAGMLEAVQQGFRPSLMTAEDIGTYRAVVREPLCAPFQAYRVCTTPPPSFGGIAVLQILQMVQALSPSGPLDFNDPGFVHLFAEAGKLAQADRRLHVGDPDQVRVPSQELVSQPYLRERAQHIDPARAMPEPTAGRPAGMTSSAAPRPLHPADTAPTAGVQPGVAGGCTSRAQAFTAQLVPDTGPTFGQTSQIAVADRQGNVVSVTTTNNLNFGARLSFDGVVLNNAMTNFSAAPRPGQALANQMAPAKRPVTSMAPTIAFDAGGRPVLAGGSAGGGPIVDYVAGSLIDMLANGRTPAQAVARPHVTTATPGVLQMERGRGLEEQATRLKAQGHAVEMVSLPSGQVYIRRVGSDWVGAADPRRDGVASSR